MNEIPRIDPALGPNAAAPTGQAPAAESGGSPRFQELLERLQRIADEQRAAEDVDSPEQLRDALRTADDGFVAAMDLRRQLEEAFKKHMP